MIEGRGLPGGNGRFSQEEIFDRIDKKLALLEMALTASGFGSGDGETDGAMLLVCECRDAMRTACQGGANV